MRVTFDTTNTEEVKEVANLLAIMGITLGTVAKPIVKQTETALEDKVIEKTTPTIPEEKKELVEPEKTKRARRTKEEIEAEKVVEAPKAEKITLAELKDLAKNKSISSGREAVKLAISKFSDKLAEVKESDYEALAEELGKL